MNTQVEIKIKSVYGVERIYPANETALELVKLTGQKTFKPEDIETLKKLGFQIKIKNEHEGRF